MSEQERFYAADEIIRQQISPIAHQLGWRQLGSLWRDPEDGKQWAWTATTLRSHLAAISDHDLFKP